MRSALQNAARFDLHMHTTLSDGAFDPEEVVQRAAEGRLDVIALTDHDLAMQVDPGLHEVDGRHVHVVAGSEVSGLHDGVEFHLLVYFQGEVPMGFRRFCEGQSKKRAERYEAAVRNIGLPDVPMPDAAAREGKRAVTRLHLARALVDAGHTHSVSESFRTHVGDAHGKVPPIDVPFTECIRLARSFGGVTSWAHPPLPMLLKYLPSFVEAGLHGIEGLRSQVTGRERRAIRRLARDHGLLLTGGSDWHGWHNPADLGLFAVHRSELKQFLDALDAAA